MSNDAIRQQLEAFGIANVGEIIYNGTPPGWWRSRSFGAMGTLPVAARLPCSPDLVSVFAGTSLSQTGQAIEIIAITMAVYLTLSLLTSAFMNWYNQRMAIKER